ncbi:MAG: helix-turn-helix transcriptional regulator [Christensenella sp.]
MSLYLSVSDYMIIVQLIYRIYSIESYADYPVHILDLLQQVVPYSSGVFCLARQDNAGAITTRMVGRNISAEYMNDLEKELPETPFMKGVLLDSSGPVVRGPSIHQFSTNMNTLHGQLVIPDDPDRAMTIVLCHNQVLLGYFVLWRDMTQNCYEQRDVCSLTTLRNHIALQLYKLNPIVCGKEEELFNMERSLGRYSLTKRELEVIYHIYAGLEEAEICQRLYFTSSTFKKHLNHIYTKLQVNNKIKLIKLVELEMHR